MPDPDAITSVAPERSLTDALGEAVRRACDPAGRVAAKVTWRGQCALVRLRRKDRARVQAWLGPFAGGAAIPVAVQPTLAAAGWQAGELGGSGRSMFLDLDVNEAGRLAGAVERAMVAAAGGEAHDGPARLDVIDDRVRWRPIVGFVAVLAVLLAGTIAVVVARVPPYAAIFDWTRGVAGTKAAAGAVFIAIASTAFAPVAGAAGIARVARRARGRT